MKQAFRSLRLLLLAGALATTYAEDLPKGYIIAEESASPDGRYGVTVPQMDELENDPSAHNSVVDLKSGKALGAIKANTGWDHMNHTDIMPAQWSPDSSLVLWYVDGKWFPWAYVLIKIEDGRIAWQTDMLKEAQQAILARTKEAAPKAYAAAKKDNEGSGSAFPEGFSVDIAATGPVELPLKLNVSLTANPKGIEGKPNVESHMQAVVDQNGKFVVKKFALGAGEPH
jgi:hypothetical protein